MANNNVAHHYIKPYLQPPSDILLGRPLVIPKLKQKLRDKNVPYRPNIR